MRAPFLALALLMCAAPAGADIWWPANSTIPSRIMVVGWNGTSPDAATGQFSVTVRDLANNPVVGSTVTLDLSSQSEVRLASNQLDAAASTHCAQRTVSKLTDAAGVVTFTLMGVGSNGSAPAGDLRLKIYADGFLLGQPLLSVLDLDGTNGAGANDFSLWLSDFGSGLYCGRGDYDGNLSLGANDLSVMLGAMGTGGSAMSPPLLCP